MASQLLLERANRPVGRAYPADYGPTKYGDMRRAVA
jgi:hypothetical protein